MVGVFTVLRTKVKTEGGVKMEVALLFVRGPLGTWRLILDPMFFSFFSYKFFFIIPKSQVSPISVK